MNFDRSRCLLFNTLLGVSLTTFAASSHALTLAESGKASATLIGASNATPSEQLAVQELADYLRRSTGASFAVLPEAQAPADGSRIFVGLTAFARSQGIDAEKLEPEEWIIQTVGKDLIIAGGRPRGTLYAAYHFLEDVVGVHWWNPFEEHVPQHASLRIDDLKLQGKPGLQYRDIFKLYGNDEGRFAARNRLNRAGDDRIATRYGGCRDYGPPSHVHTFNRYFPPEEFFAKHPDWYSLAGGKRLGERGQLCLTNPEMRLAFLAKLRGYIDISWAEARAAGDLPPLVFSVSQNDWPNPCRCDNCQAIAKAEESECGPLLDFVNYLADAIKEQYPGVYLDTLAYQYTQKPPKTIKPRDNVIIRLCDTGSDKRLPITAPENTAFREHLIRWAQIARNLRVWDYAVTFWNPVGMPMPTAQTFGPDFRFYSTHNVEGVFTELEFPILADMRDFKVWMLMKQLEDPSASYETLVQTFTDGFYGPAGNFIRQYLTGLEQEAVARRTRRDGNSSSLQSLTYLNLAFVTRAHQLFDQAEKAVKNDATLLRRVRHARLPIDRATQALYPQLTSEWLALGQPPESELPDRKATGQRALDTWLAQTSLRLPAAAQKKERGLAVAEMKSFAAVPAIVTLPEKFRAKPKGSVHDFIATMTRNYRDIVRVVEDPEAETGVTNHLDLTSARVEHLERYVLPIKWGLYSSRRKKIWAEMRSSRRTSLAQAITGIGWAPTRSRRVTKSLSSGARSLRSKWNPPMILPIPIRNTRSGRASSSPVRASLTPAPARKTPSTSSESSSRNPNAKPGAVGARSGEPPLDEAALTEPPPTPGLRREGNQGNGKVRFSSRPRMEGAERLLRPFGGVRIGVRA